MGLTGSATKSRYPVDVWLPRLVWATLVVNILIVVSGGVVRLTGSGLGCPTWPQCTADSFTPHAAMGVHAVIEFSNRTITFVMAAVAIATYVAARRYGRRSLTRLALWLAIGVPVQAVIGGISVLTELNPWVVSLHLVTSMAMINLAVLLLRRMGERDVPAHMTVAIPVSRLVQAVYAVGWIVLYLGTVVTGSGPHAGDEKAPRNGFNPKDVSQLHADFVFLLLGLTIAAYVVLRATEAPLIAHRAVQMVLLVEVFQGVVGYTQYFTKLPMGLVTLHLLGAALLAATTTWLLLSVRERRPVES